MTDYEKKNYPEGVYSVKVVTKAKDDVPKNSSVNQNVSGSKERAETAIDELRNRYARQLRAQFEGAEEKLRAEKNDALRENWVLEQQEEASLPEKLAAEGVNGGATETTLAGMKAKYQGDRNNIRREYIDELGDLYSEHGEQQAKNAKDYDEKWLDYLISLAEKEDEYRSKAGYGFYY